MKFHLHSSCGRDGPTPCRRVVGEKARECAKARITCGSGRTLASMPYRCETLTGSSVSTTEFEFPPNGESHRSSYLGGSSKRKKARRWQ